MWRLVAFVLSVTVILPAAAQASVFKKICEMLIEDYPHPFEHVPDDMLLNRLERLRIRVHFGYESAAEKKEHDQLVKELNRRRKLLGLEGESK